MNLQPSLQHAEAYINIHASRTGPDCHGKPPGPFVTISRESGTGVVTFANHLASRLDHELPGEKPWTVFDANLVVTMLNSRELSPRLAAFLPEDKVSDFEASVGEIVGLHPSLWELTQRTNDMMRQFVRAGHVILVGRGANFATGDIAHMRLTGSMIETPRYPPYLTARQVLRWLALEHGIGGTADIPYWLERVGLAEAADRKVRGFSVGMMQRLGVAAALSWQAVLHISEQRLGAYASMLYDRATELDAEVRTTLDSFNRYRHTRDWTPADRAFSRAMTRSVSAA